MSASRFGVRVKRGLAVLMLATAPVAVLMWVGCSDDPGVAGPTIVDPGGTYGAELQVEVDGPGRVISSIPGVDCPNNCFAKFIFPSSTAAGAADGVTLKAINTPTTRFSGWKFDATPVGTRGKGPDQCSPVARAGEQPAGDKSAPEIKLAFGVVNGSAPAGKEGLCAPHTQVPLVYTVTATFEQIPIPDSGPGEIAFQPPVAGAVAKEIVSLGSRLYWKFEVGGMAGIATATTNVSTPTIAVPATGLIQSLDVTPVYVLYQTGTSVGYFTSGSVIPSTVPGLAPTCTAMESDPSTGNILCRVGTTLTSVTTGGVSTVVTTNLPIGGDRFAVDATYYYFAADPGGVGLASIQRALKSAADGGAQLPFLDIVVGQTNPTKLRATSSSRLAWINYETGTGVGQAQSVFGSGIPTTIVTGTPGLRLLIPDATSSTTVWAGVVSSLSGDQIFRASTSGGVAVPVVIGIPGLVSLAADSTYIYWTQVGDGRVYRRTKF